MRRIKTVALTVPVTNAPLGSVNCKLTLDSSEVQSTADGTLAAFDYRPIQSIVTSTAQQDNGMFELLFRDERYLPFEGAGAISTWSIELKKEGNRFDPTTIHDVVMHLRYTAREEANNEAAPPTGVLGHRLFSARADFPAEWHAFIHGTGEPPVHELHLPLALRHFQPLVGKEAQQITQIHLFARRVDESASPGALVITVSKPKAAGTVAPTLTANTSTYGTIIRAENVSINGAVGIFTETANDFGPWKLTVPTLELLLLDDIWFVCDYVGT